MAVVLFLRVCAVLLLCSNALAKKGGKESKIDTSDVLNPDPEAPNADDTGEYNTGPDMVEGDIKVEEGAKGELRNAASDPNKLWPQGVVPYILAPNAQTPEVRRVLQQAIDDYNQFTCVKFQPRKNEVDYVRFTTEFKGCWSLLGRAGGEQNLNLGWGCVYKGTTIHEMMHAIGFQHEQKRGDRDNYVTIHFDNILKDQQHNFEKIPEGEEDNQNFGYDYSSLMHYGPTAFAIDYGRYTITTNDPRNQNKIGQRAGFSRQDIQEVNLLYRCVGKRSGIKGVNGCLDKHRDYCENVLGLKGQTNPSCDQRTKEYCMVSCNACDPQDGRHDAGCADGDREYCEDVLKLKSGPNKNCKYTNTRDYCKKSCQAC